jgi:hypothetical protein
MATTHPQPIATVLADLAAVPFRDGAADLWHRIPVFCLLRAMRASTD